MAFKSSHVYASYLSPLEKVKQLEEFDVKTREREPPRTREIQVWATGEAFTTPNRARVSVVVRSQKETVAEAKNSVSRRLDYVIQTLHTHNVKEGDVNTTRSIRRVDGLFHVEAEVVIAFIDFNRCHEVCNFLVEKLDDSVSVSLPNFFHAAQTLDNVRRQACLNAVKNARQKALDVARLLRQSLGHPIAIKEEQCSEWEGPAKSQELANGQEGPLTMQQRQTNGTVNVSVKVLATFELVPRDKGKGEKT